MNNSAKDAGAVVLSVVGEGNTTTVTGSLFSDNSTISRRGALFFGSPTALAKTTVFGNTPEFGGGICNDDEVVGEVSLVTGNSPDDLCPLDMGD